MIGLAYQKFAREMGMKIGNGIAYGSLRGYSATLCEGAGWKQITVNTMIPDGWERFLVRMNPEQNNKRFAIREVRCGSRSITVYFTDTIGTLKRIRAFCDWFFPLLDAAGAEKVQICDACGLELMDSGVWKMVDGLAYHVHSSCGSKLETDIRHLEQSRREDVSGSYTTGLIGALLGALLGAVVWAVLYEMGYVASIVGLLIAFLSVKGYELLHGRQGKGMIAVILLAVVFGVAAGNLMAYLWELADLVQSGELPIGMGQIPAFLLEMLREHEFLTVVLKELGMGLVFALMGAFGIVSRAAKSVGNTKIVDLK